MLLWRMKNHREWLGLIVLAATFWASAEPAQAQCPM